MPRATQLLLLLLPAAQSHFHQSWEEGSLYGYKWYGQDWVKVVRDFYCDESCQHRLEESPTIDRMVRAVRRGPTFSPPLPLARVRRLEIWSCSWRRRPVLSICWRYARREFIHA